MHFPNPEGQDLSRGDPSLAWILARPFVTAGIGARWAMCDEAKTDRCLFRSSGSGDLTVFCRLFARDKFPCLFVECFILRIPQAQSVMPTVPGTDTASPSGRAVHLPLCSSYTPNPPAARNADLTTLVRFCGTHARPFAFGEGVSGTGPMALRRS